MSGENLPSTKNLVFCPGRILPGTKNLVFCPGRILTSTKNFKTPQDKKP
jgi:hypothetical protein